MSVGHSARLRECSPSPPSLTPLSPGPPGNGQSPKYNLAPFKEITILWYYQSHLVLVIAWHVRYLYPQDHVAQGSVIFPPPHPLSGMYPLWSFRSWIEPTSRPLFFTNSGVTKFTRAPLSIRQVVFIPSIIAVPKFEWSNHWFLGSSFENAEGVSRGFVNFWPGLDRTWPYPSGGARLPWPQLPHPGLTTVFSGLLFP